MIPLDPIWAGIIGGLIIGVAVGSLITVVAMVERPRRWWWFCIRLPEALRVKLTQAAAGNMWSLEAEIIGRLERSFGGRP